jgi:hypothetical protein
MPPPLCGGSSNLKFQAPKIASGVDGVLETAFCFFEDWSLGIGISAATRRWVADGTRTRNNQNHNLELYH